MRQSGGDTASINFAQRIMDATQRHVVVLWNALANIALLMPACMTQPTSRDSTCTIDWLNAVICVP